MKKYDAKFGLIPNYLTPCDESNHLNAQDVVYSLVTQAKSVADASMCLFNDDLQLTCNQEIIYNMIWDLQTKLSIIENNLQKSWGNE